MKKICQYKHAQTVCVFNKKIDTKSFGFFHIGCSTQVVLLKDAFEFLPHVKYKINRYSFIAFNGEHAVPYWAQAIRRIFMIMQQQHL